MIINLRGTSGAGKTTIVRDLMESRRHQDITDRKGRVIAVEIAMGPLARLYVIGRYDNVCGGCDTIKTQDEVRRRIKKFAKEGHVLFEGLTIGNGYTKNLALMRRLGQPFAFAFLDTPLRTCISRVKKRRKAAGNTKPFNTANTEKLFWSNLRFLQRAVYDDANPVVLNHHDATNELVALIRKNPL